MALQWLPLLRGQLVIGRISASGVRVTYLPDSLLEGESVLQQLSSGRLGPLAQAPLTLRAVLQLSRPQPLQLTLDGQLTLKQSANLRGLALSDLQLAVSGEGAGVQALQLAMSASLAWDGSVLSAAPLRLSMSQATLGATRQGASTRLADAGALHAGQPRA